MHTEHDNRINGGSDCTALRNELKYAIMELPVAEQYEILREYAEKYGINLFGFFC